MTGLWLIAGALVGLFNSLTRWWAVAQIRSDMKRSALALTLGGMMLRLALIAVLLVLGLKRGLIPGLLAFGGLWLVRMAAVIWIQTSEVLWTNPSGAVGSAAGLASGGEADER